MRRTVPLLPLVLATILAAPGALSGQGGSGPFMISGSQRHVLSDPEIGQDFTLTVAVPWGYEASEDRYPVLYFLDSELLFGTAVETARWLAYAGETEPLIVVGIGYGDVSLDEWSMLRSRDYTPTVDAESDRRKRETTPSAPDKLSGGAPELLDFIRSRVKPFVDDTYRSLPGQAGFFGDSFGGLFALYTLFHAPDTFSRYIAGSPSIWWDDSVTLKYEDAYAADHEDLPVRLFLSVGLDEEDPSIPALAEAKMVTNVRTLASRLESRSYPGLTLQTHYFEGENHVTVIPSNFSRGLRAVFPAKPRPDDPQGD